MKIFLKHKLKPGFGVLEILLASSILVLLLTSVVGLLLYGRDSLERDNLSSRASLLANEALTAVENIRDTSFPSLTDGIYGLAYSAGEWSLQGESDEIGNFTRRTTISSISDTEKKVSVEVTWFKKFSRLGRIVLSKYLTNWTEVALEPVSWWDEDWACRKEIQINNSSGSQSLVNTQILISLNTEELISNSKMNSDCSDVRFVNSDNNLILSYWIEPGTCNSSESKFWVKVPFISSFSMENIYFYYGNLLAGGVSSIDDTFIREINTGSPLVLDLPFDEGSGSIANDFSGNNNNGSITGATWVNGVFKDALDFNGSSDYVSIPNSASLNPPSITLSAWVKWNINPSSGNQWSSIINKDSDSQYRLHHNSNNSLFEFAIRTSSGARWVVSETSPVQGVWYFLVGTYNGSSLKIYVNGQLEGEISHSGDILVSTSDVRIGSRSSNDRYFNGVIDKPQIYNRELTAGEIIDLYSHYGQALLSYPGKTLVRKYYNTLSLPVSITDELCFSEDSSVSATVDIYDDWVSGYCATVTVSASSSDPIVWEVDIEVDGIPSSVWEANWSFLAPILTASGLAYNNTVVVDEPVTFGFCANRVEEEYPVQEADYTVVIDSDWGAAYCATVNVTTTSLTPITWWVDVDLSAPPSNGTPYSVWGADWSFTAPILTASGLSWNNKFISSGSPTSFGYCANRPLPQANYITVDASNSYAGGTGNRSVYDIYLTNNGSNNAELSSISLNWTGSPASILREVFINNASIWTGTVSRNGSAIFLANYILTPGGGPYNLRLRFQHSFSGRTISYINFNFSDGSVKTVGPFSL